MGQGWCLIVSIPDRCPLSYFVAYIHQPSKTQHSGLGDSSFNISGIIADTILDEMSFTNGHLCDIAVGQG